MGHARRRSSRQGGASRGLPGWAMLTIGLIIGLFVAFLVYLDDLQAPPNATAERPSSTDRGADDAEGGESDGPRFEFYSILPELEVVVPEFGGSASDEAADADADESSGASSPAGGSTVTKDGRYFLQAGSFRKAAQADRLKAEIALLGLDVSIQDVRVDGEQWHRVRVGPYGADSGLQSAQQRLRQNDIDYLVMREKSSG